MKTRTLFPAVALAALLLSLRAGADAPKKPAQYGPFTSESPTVKDAFTKLEWDRYTVRPNVKATDARCDLVTSLDGGGRLPTVKELLTIFDEEPDEQYEFGALVFKSIDAAAFPKTAVDKPYWTSTPGPTLNTYWTLSFATGAMTARPATDQAHARCVR